MLSWDGSPTSDKTKEIDIDMADLTNGYTDKFYWQDSDVGEKLTFIIMKGDSDVAWFSPEPVNTTGGSEFFSQDFTIPKNKISYGTNNFTVNVYRDGQSDPEQIEYGSATIWLHI